MKCSSRTHLRACLGLAFVLATALFVGTHSVQAQVVTNGVANTTQIDGNLVAEPGGTDWLDGPTACVAGTGGLLNNTGTPKAPMPSGFLFVTNSLDGVGGADTTRFTGGSKFNQNPSAWAWDCQKPNDKVDINHGFVGISLDASNHLWAVVAGDRSSNNGDAYIDFEFLQHSFFRNGSCPGNGFTSNGPDGGRTVGDLLLTIHFVNGGVIPEFYALIWTNDASSANGYSYKPITPPPGAAFVAQNNAAAAVCFGAYGKTTYDVNTFAEAGADLSTLIPALRNNRCFTISTVFIKTKTSQSDTAELKDFIEPIQLNLCVDDIPPVITGCPAPITVQCDSAVPPPDPSLITAEDNCPAAVTKSWVSDTSSNTCPKYITRTYRATDGCGNSNDCTQVITVHDTTGPVLVGVPANTNFQCVGEVPAAPAVTATDNCDSSLTVGLATETTGSACNQTITRTWTVTDSCGNTASATQTITVRDTTAPVVTKGSIATCYTSVAAAEAAAKAATTVSDNCGGEVTKSASTVGDCSAEITVTGTDACGNSASVTYNTRVDTTPPVLPALPAGGSLGCNPTLPSCTTGLKATDNCDGELAVTCTPGETTGTDCAKSQTFTYSATDGCGNTSSATVTYTWKIDTTAPVLPTLPAGGNLGCNPTLPTCTAGLKATDNCDGEVAVTCTPGAITGTDCNKSQTFTYSATDACGNTSSATVTYTWKVDTTAPVLPALPAGGNLGCNPTLPTCTTGLKATDNCDGEVAVTCTPGAITGADCNKSQTFTYSATDGCGNTSSATVTYTWKIDTTAPVLPTLPAGGNLGCNPTPPTCATGLKATDNCDGEVAVTCTPGDITGTDCNKSQTFTYSATDACGNTSSATVTYTWKVDTTAPSLTVAATKTIACGGELAFDTPQVSDNCDAGLAAVVVSTVTNTVTPLSVTRTWSATDSCGNAATPASQTVTLQLCGQGCTPGYWKNHPDSWPATGFAVNQKLNTVFNFGPAPGPVAALGGKTLMEALNFQGGTNLKGAGEILLRASVAALLSAAHPGVGYTLNEVDVLSAVNTALASGDRATMLEAARILDAYNNLQCPLN